MIDDPFRQSEHQRQLDRAYEFYRGTPPKPFRVRANGVDDNLIISLARLVVDKGASFLFGQPVTAQVTGTASEPEQAWLDECWRWNKRGITLLKAATNGGIFGHCFLRVLEAKPFPRLIVLDPKTVDVQTDPDDIDAVWSITINPPPKAVEGEDHPVRTRTRIVSPSGQAGERVETDEPQWFIEQQEYRVGAWITTQSEDWPYPFMPVFQCQNIPTPNQFWGESDIPEDVLQILGGINRVASNYAKVIRIHASPKVWSRGMGSNKLDLSTDTVTHLPGDTAELRVLEMQSDLSSTMALLEKLLNLLSFMVRIPMVAMGEPDALGSLSGVSLQIRYQPLIEKTEAKRLTYGDMLAELDRCLLMMGGFQTVAPTELIWPNIMPSDLLEERQVAALDEGLGVASKHTIAESLGYDYDKEYALRVQEVQQQRKDGLAPDPTQTTDEPPVAPLQAQMPDQAKRGKSV